MTTAMSGEPLSVNGATLSQRPGAPAVSVVIATHQRAARVARLLDSLRAQTLPPERFEVIAVDDASTDPTAAVLARAQDRGGPVLRVIRRARRGGPSAARNDGWRAARAPLVAFIDDDCTAAPRWLEELVAKAGAAPGSIVQGATAPDPAEAGLLGPFSRSLWVQREGPYYQAANILYPRDVLERLGGFDAEAFPDVGEDTDLAWRAKRSGVPTEWAPGARALHAVHRLGPVGALRMALRWTPSIRLFRRHPQLRPVHLDGGVFWQRSHRLLLEALIGLALPRRLWPLRWMALVPYLRNVAERARAEGGGPAAAPYYALYDLVELFAVVRGAVRYRTPVL
jgi:glycosyltransferase involved in cell wall biosynthesis